MPVLSREYWGKLARANVMNVTDADAARIAELCCDSPESFPNGRPSIWHAASVVYGHPCRCGPCEQARQG